MSKPFLIRFCFYPEPISVLNKNKSLRTQVGSCIGMISPSGSAEVYGPYNEIENLQNCIKKIFTKSKIYNKQPQVGYVFLPQDIYDRKLGEMSAISVAKEYFSRKEIHKTNNGNFYIEFSNPFS